MTLGWRDPRGNKIGKEICKVAGDENLEQTAITGVCATQQKVDTPDCTEGLTKFWDVIRDACDGTIDKSTITQQACTVAQDELLEKTVVQTACAKQSKVPEAQCVAGLTTAWDALEAQACSSNALPQLTVTHARASDENEWRKGRKLQFSFSTDNFKAKINKIGKEI